MGTPVGLRDSLGFFLERGGALALALGGLPPLGAGVGGVFGFGLRLAWPIKKTRLMWCGSLLGCPRVVRVQIDGLQVRPDL